MPLAGTICCQTGKPTSFEHCQMCSLQGLCAFARPLIDEMAQKEDSRAGTGISATALLGCPRAYALSATSDYFESPADYHARWLGTAVHRAATQYGPYPGVIQERRIRMPIDTPAGGGILTGQADWYDAERRYLEDWKHTRKAPNAPYDDHKAQVNIYALLIEKGRYDPLSASESVLEQLLKDDPAELYAPLSVESAAIRYLDKDRSPAVPVDLWSTWAAEDFVVKRMTPIVQWERTGELPSGIPRGGENEWKIRFCPFRGTGKCCGDE